MSQEEIDRHNRGAKIARIACFFLGLVLIFIGLAVVTYGDGLVDVCGGIFFLLGGVFLYLELAASLQDDGYMGY